MNADQAICFKHCASLDRNKDIGPGIPAECSCGQAKKIVCVSIRNAAGDITFVRWSQAMGVLESILDGCERNEDGHFPDYTVRVTELHWDVYEDLQTDEVFK